jgi:hypothetical protein
MSTSLWRLVGLSFLIALSSHLLAEIIRRFFVYSSFPYALADISLVFAAAFVLPKCRVKVSTILLGFLIVYVLVGGISLGVSGNSPLLFLVGLRPLVLALSCYAVAIGYFKTAPDPQNALLNILFSLTLIVFVVGVLQVVMGVDSYITKLPDAAWTEGGGRGDYVGGDFGGLDFFRPTSIFMHTGRLGQFSFFTVIVLLSAAVTTKGHWKSRYLFAFIAILLVLLSGQRSAMLFAILGFILLIGLQKNSKAFFGLGVVGFFAAAVLFVLDSDLSRLVIARFSSGFTGSDDRVSESFLGASVGFEKFFLFGEGLGFFSFGGQPYGGKIYYEYMPRFGGGGENGWLRIQGESGNPGLIVFLTMVIWISSVSFRRFLAEKNQAFRAIHFSSGYIGVALSGWAITHDVFGNYLMLMQWFLVFGASSGLALRRPIKPAHTVVVHG